MENNKIEFTVDELMEIKRAVNTLIEDRVLYSVEDISDEEKEIVESQIEKDYKLSKKILDYIVMEWKK